MLHCESASSVSAVDPAEWDVLAGPYGYYLSHQWIRFVEADPSARAEYLLVRQDGRLVAALPVYDVAAEQNDFYRPGNLADGRWRGHYLIAGARRAYANGLLVHPALEAAERIQAAELLLRTLAGRVRRHDAAGALFLYMPTAAAGEVQQATGAIAARGLPLLAAADSHLDAPGSDIGDYLASLPTSHRRRRLAREITVFSGAGYEVSQESPRDSWREAGALLGNLQRRYGHEGTDEVWQAIVGRQAEYLGDRGVLFACRSRGRLVAFSLGYPFLDTLYMRMAGFDYAQLRNAFEYFNLAIYLPLRYVYAHGMRRIHLGMESYDAKIRRGAVLTPLWNVAVYERRPGDPDTDLAWNRQAAIPLISQYGYESHGLADPGWSSWGCAATAPGSAT
jgi:predicted N-acyltransferase